MHYDLIIIGSGPAGYVAAIKAGQTGLKTLVIDKKYVGGMCLNWGCIPTKSLLESAKLYDKIINSSLVFGIEGIEPSKLELNWQQAKKRSTGIVNKLGRGIEYLWKKNGVEFLMAEANILTPTSVRAGDKVFNTKQIMIATGSKPATQSFFPTVIELEDFLALEKLPEKPVLYGRGAIIAELAQFFAMLGKQTIVVASDLPLIPKLDSSLEAFILKNLRKRKIQVFKEADVKLIGNSMQVQDKSYEFDVVLNCSLRQAVLPPMDIQLKLSDGYLWTDENNQTSIPGIYAAGDVNGMSYLAHAASDQGLRIIEHINGINNDATTYYPINIYTDPELAQIGLTEVELKDKGIDYQIREFGFNANGKALAEGASEGFIRLLFEPKYHQVLGVQIAGNNATDLISEASILMELEGTVYDLAKAVHAHPTISEVFMDVARE